MQIPPSLVQQSHTICKFLLNSHINLIPYANSSFAGTQHAFSATSVFRYLSESYLCQSEESDDVIPQQSIGNNNSKSYTHKLPAAESFDTCFQSNTSFNQSTIHDSTFPFV